METLDFKIIIEVVVFTATMLFVIIILLFYKNESLAKLNAVMFEDITSVCKKAKTYSEVMDAWTLLHSKCIVKNEFIIHTAYVKDFNYLRAYLQGKLSIVNSFATTPILSEIEQNILEHKTQANEHHRRNQKEIQGTRRIDRVP